MAVKIRLRRVGAKHQPSYRIVVADSRSPRDGRFIDQVGTYNPRTHPATVTLNRDKAIEWLRKGAQPTETVEILLKKASIVPSEVRKGDAPAGAGVYSQGPAAKPQPEFGASPTATAAAVQPDAAAQESAAGPGRDGGEVVADVTPADSGEVVTVEVEPSEIQVPDEGE